MDSDRSGIIRRQAAIREACVPEGPGPKADLLARRPCHWRNKVFQLEQEKFKFEKSKARGAGFFNNNLGIIITAIIGAATVSVSYFQLMIQPRNQCRADRAAEDDQQRTA